MRRFNEALDEALTASMNRFAIRTDLFRDQFIGVLSHDLRTPLGAIAAGLVALGMTENKPTGENSLSAACRIARNAWSG